MSFGHDWLKRIFAKKNGNNLNKDLVIAALINVHQQPML